jgi:copper chaperone CopZ
VEFRLRQQIAATQRSRLARWTMRFSASQLRVIEGAMCREADQVWTTSEDDADLMAQTYPWTKSIRVIPNGVDLAFFASVRDGSCAPAMRVAMGRPIAPRPRKAVCMRTKLRRHYLSRMISRARVEGMSCQHCVRAVFTALAAIDGITRADVRIGTVEIEHDGRATADQLREAIGRWFSNVDFIPAHPKAFVEGKH